jgi:hypothetical protein
LVIRWFFIGAKINIFFEISNILFEFVSPASLFVLSPHPSFAVPSLPYFSCHAVSFHFVLHGVARLRICTVMLHYIYRHRMANACSRTVAVLSLMPVHDWSEDYASFVSSPVINRIPVSLGLSLRPTSFPSLPYFSCHAVSFHSVLHGVARLRICAIMLHFIYRHRMANACSGTVPVLSLMPVHDWSEDYARFVSSPVINRIPVSLSLSLRPTVARHHEEVSCRCLTSPNPMMGTETLHVA